MPGKLQYDGYKRTRGRMGKGLSLARRLHQKRPVQTHRWPTGSTATASPLCTYSVDPHKKESGKCICSNTVTLAPAESTGSNTGASYQPCSMTTLPPSPTTKGSTTIPSNNPQYGFTTTLANSNVIACQSASLANFCGHRATLCAGSSATLKAAQRFSCKLGNKNKTLDC